MSLYTKYVADLHDAPIPLLLPPLLHKNECEGICEVLEGHIPSISRLKGKTLYGIYVLQAPYGGKKTGQAVDRVQATVLTLQKCVCQYSGSLVQFR